MTTHSGIFPQGVIYEEVPSDDAYLHITDNLGLAYELVVSPLSEGMLLGLPSLGIKKDYWADRFRINRGGIVMKSFFDDFYGRIHITPEVSDLNYVAATTTREIEVWNSYFDIKHMDTIVPANDDGITYEGVSVPYDFLPLSAQVFTFTINSKGPSTIAATYLFHFTDAEDLSATIRGYRTLMFSFQPNWAHPVLERLEYLTDVMETRNGMEQRVNLRKSPRQVLEYGITVYGNVMHRLNSMLFRWQGRQWAVPLWFHGQKLSANVASGQTVLPVATDSYEFSVGSNIAIFADQNTYEAIEIKELTADSITLLTPVQADWPQGSMIFPLRTGSLQEEVVQSRINADVTNVELRFLIEDSRIQDVTLTNIYQDLPVLDIIPNRINTLDDRWTRRIERFDNETSRSVTFDVLGFSTSVRSHAFTQMDRADIKLFREFVVSRKGRWKSFWSPSYNRDMTVVAISLASSNTLFIEWQGYTDNYALHAYRRDIVITMRSGLVMYRRIVAADDTTTESGVEALVLDNTFGVDISPDHVSNVSFLIHSRFDSDTLEINWHTPNVAECSAGIKGVLA